jgi:hypothetical protein
LLGNGIQAPHVTAHHLQQADVPEAIRNNGQNSGLPFLLVDHLLRHDWHHTGDCIYTVRVFGDRFSGPVDRLEATYAGVRYALWQYWRARGNVRSTNVANYLAFAGRDKFHSTLMWPFLDTDEWLTYWRNRRASRRV